MPQVLSDEDVGLGAAPVKVLSDEDVGLTPAPAPAPKRAAAVNPRPFAGRMADVASKIIGPSEGMGLAGFAKAFTEPGLTAERAFGADKFQGIPVTVPEQNKGMAKGVGEFVKSLIQGGTSSEGLAQFAEPFKMVSQMAMNAPEQAAAFGKAIANKDAASATESLLNYALSVAPAAGALRAGPQLPQNKAKLAARMLNESPLSPPTEAAPVPQVRQVSQTPIVPPGRGLTWPDTPLSPMLRPEIRLPGPPPPPMPLALRPKPPSSIPSLRVLPPGLFPPPALTRRLLHAPGQSAEDLEFEREVGPIGLPPHGLPAPKISEADFPKRPKPAVPEAGTAERQPGVQEIRAAGAQTIPAIQKLFGAANINREQARVWRDAAWPEKPWLPKPGQQPPPSGTASEPPPAPPRPPIAPPPPGVVPAATTAQVLGLAPPRPEALPRPAPAPPRPVPKRAPVPAAQPTPVVPTTNPKPIESQLVVPKPAPPPVSAAAPEAKPVEAAPTKEQDAAEYKKVQARMAALDPASPTFDKDFQAIGAEMEAIKNRNNGYAPGTEPKEVPAPAPAAVQPPAAGAGTVKAAEKPWYEQSAKEKIFDAMRRIQDRVDSASASERGLRAPQGTIPAGAAGFDEFIKSESQAQVLRGVRKGMAPEQAGEAAKQWAREAVQTHNAKRPKNVNWARADMTADSHIDRAVRELTDAAQPPPRRACS